MKKRLLVSALCAAFLVLPAVALGATTPSLGTAGTFGVLSSTFTRNGGLTAITGNLGYTTLSGGGTHSVSGSTVTPTPALASTDQGVALAALNSEVCTFAFAPGAIDLSIDTTHGPIGVYTPGVYCVDGAMSVGTGGITLSGSGTYIFRSTGALNTVANSHVTLDGASACDVFWTPVATTLGANSTFVGTVIDNAGITVGSTVTWLGRALNAATTVTTDTDIITVPTNCGGGTTPTTVKVTIDKFLNGQQATAVSASSASFPMSATWSATNIGSGSGTFALGPIGFNSPNPYEAITSDMTTGASYSTNEITSGPVVGASCADGKPYALVGYTTGSTLAIAAAATPGATIPSFTNLQSDKYVIVWNQSCSSGISGSKFWDINGNGIWDSTLGEPGLGNWTINLAGTAVGSQVTGGTGAYGFTNLAAGLYTLSEVLQTGWTQTLAPGPITLGVGQVLNNQNFGNACFVSTNGRTLGFWSNKNGQAVMNDGGTLAPELALLSVLNNLRNKNGTDFNPATYAIFKNWLLKADATNMAYMLSAQLAAVALSVEAGLTNGSASIVALDLLPFTAQITAAGVTISGLGVITINDLMTAANVALLADENTPSGDVNRAYQEALKNALDAIANGQNIQVCAVVIN